MTKLLKPITIPQHQAPKAWDPDIVAKLGKETFHGPAIEPSEETLLPDMNPGPGHFNCKSCQLFKGCKTPFMKPYVPKDWTGKYIFVGEGPGEHEDIKSKRPFTGKAGKLIHKIRRKADIEKKDIIYMNAVRCRPKKNATPSMKEIRCCRDFLVKDIMHYAKPTTKIVGLGVSALKSLTNKGSGVSVITHRGKPVHIEGTVELSAHITYHPAAILHGALHLKKTILDDLKLIDKAKIPAPDCEIPKFTITVGVDTEYAPDGSLLTLGAATLTKAFAVEEFFNDPLSPVIDNASILVGHNLPGDIDQLLKLGFKHTGWLSGKNIQDSLLMARMVDENKERGGYGLENLACAELGVDPWKGETETILKATGDARNLTPLQRTERCRMDAWASYLLARHYLPKLPSKMLSMFNHQIEMSLHRIGLTGAAVDMDLFYKLGSAWKIEAIKLKDLLEREVLSKGFDADSPFSPTNDNHIRYVLYELLGLKVIKKTEKTKKPCVDRFVLAKHVEEGSQFAKNLLEFNKVDKLASTWIGGSKTKRKTLEELIDIKKLLTEPPGTVAYGLLHFWINPLGARTGRRTSGGVANEGTPESRNGQNWPQDARRMIVSRWASTGGHICSVDFRKLEPVLFGWNANDEKMVDFFLNGEGYTLVAREVLGLEIQEGTPQYKAIKAIMLGIQYNMKLYKTAMEVQKVLPFSNDWKTHVNKVKHMRRAIYRLFPGIKPYIRKQLRELADTQQVVAATGAIRHLPHDGPDSEGYWHLENQAVNFPTQHLASMVTGCAMVDYETKMLEAHQIHRVDWQEQLLSDPWHLQASPLIDEIHDELLLDMHPGNGKQDVSILVDCAEHIRTLRDIVPSLMLTLKVKVHISDSWGT